MGEEWRPYAEWLSEQEWSHWATWTFRRYDPEPDAAMRRWREISERWVPPEAVWFSCVESGRLYGRTHLHSLLWCGNGEVDDLARSWKKTTGLHHVRPYRMTGGATSYAAKYCGKDMALWDVSPSFAQGPEWSPEAGTCGKWYSGLGWRSQNTESGHSSRSGESPDRWPKIWSTWHSTGGPISVAASNLASFQAEGLRSTRPFCRIDGTAVTGEDWQLGPPIQTRAPIVEVRQ